MACCCLSSFTLNNIDHDDRGGIVITPSNLILDDIDDDGVSFGIMNRNGVSPTFDEEDELLSKDLKPDLADAHETVSLLSSDTWSIVPWLKAVNASMQQSPTDPQLELANTGIFDLQSILTRSPQNPSIKLGLVRNAMKAVCQAERVDIAFVIDATGSMLRHIKNVKQSIRNIITKIRRTHAKLRIRLAVVAYRDLSDARPCEVLDFVSSIDRFEAFLSTLRAVGGADTPEDMAGGIRQVNRLSWQHPTRLVFVIADAPCHGIEFHNFPDNYPSGTPGINVVNELRKLLNNQGRDSTMAVYFGRISHATDQMILRMRSKYGVRMCVATMTDVPKITSTVTKAVRAAIFKTVTTLCQREAKTGSISDAKSSLWLPEVRCSPYPILSEEAYVDDWEAREIVPVKVYRNNPIQSTCDLEQPLGATMLHSPASPISSMGQSTWLLRHSPAPFSQGSTRIASHGKLAHNESELGELHSIKVLKAFAQNSDRFEYYGQMEMSTVAGYLASLYNRSRPRHCASIQVLEVCVIEGIDASSGSFHYCVEPPMPTTGSAFTKYSNNMGHWNIDVIDESLLRFTQFTYQATNGYLMVTNLQGVRDGTTYYLTDPVILCRDMNRFGSSNLGEKFMSKTLASTRYLLEERSRYSV